MLRPSDPPPPPPINLDTHPLNLAPAPGSVATLAAEISVSVRGLTSELGSGLEEEEGETIYFSRLTIVTTIQSVSAVNILLLLTSIVNTAARSLPAYMAVRDAI